MQKREKHRSVCTTARPNGTQKGFCHTKTGVDVMQKFMEEIEERGTGAKSSSPTPAASESARRGRSLPLTRTMSGTVQ